MFLYHPTTWLVKGFRAKVSTYMYMIHLLTHRKHKIMLQSVSIETGN